MSRLHAAPLRLLRGFILVCTLFLVSTAASCDEDEPSGPGSSIAGLWLSDDGDLVLEITSTTLTVHFFDNEEDCYVEDEEYEIVDRDGDLYTLEDSEGDDFDIELDRDGNELEVSEGGPSEVFTRLDRDDFEEC